MDNIFEQRKEEQAVIYAKITELVSKDGGLDCSELQRAIGMHECADCDDLTWNLYHVENAGWVCRHCWKAHGSPQSIFRRDKMENKINEEIPPVDGFGGVLQHCHDCGDDYYCQPNQERFGCSTCYRCSERARKEE